jgi:hypothetical protein
MPQIEPLGGLDPSDKLNSMSEREVLGNIADFMLC